MKRGGRTMPKYALALKAAKKIFLIFERIFV